MMGAELPLRIDDSPAALLRMVVHAKTCQRGRNLAVEQRRAS